MNIKFRIICMAAILILAGLACSAPGGSPTANPLDQIGTQVASTLTALSLSQPQVTTEAPPTKNGPTLVPTETPQPAVLRVAYVKNGNAWVWTDGGGAVQLTNSGDVQDLKISTDGQVIAILRNIGPTSDELWAVNNDGSNARVLVSAADFMATYSISAVELPSGISAFQFGWQPGTHNLFFNTRPIYEGPGGSFGYDDLYMVNADSLAKQTLFLANGGGKFFFSPDGTQLALVRPTSLSLVNADGSNLRPNLITFPSVITYSEYLYYPRPVWAPDASGLKVVIPPADPLAEPLLPSSVIYLPMDGSPTYSVGSILAIPFSWPDSAISPDLSRLGFAQPTGAPADNLRDIHIVNPGPGGDYVFIGGENGIFEGWLPNSTQFVFSINSGAAMGTHVGDVSGGYTTLAVDPTQINNISWPDSTHFLYLWNNAGTKELRYNLLGGVGSILLDSGEIWGYDFSN
jgi:hypothetical protein